MKKFFLIILPILVVGMFTFTQCKEGKESDKSDEFVLCTDVLVTIGILLKYPDGQPVLLDSSRVFWVSKNRYLEQNLVLWNEARAWGSYSIVHDGMRKELQNKEEIMHFTGYLNNEIVHEQDVLVGADACHVKYLGTESLSHTIYDIPDDIGNSLNINKISNNTKHYQYE